jgi:hypothetical protein
VKRILSFLLPQEDTNVIVLYAGVHGVLMVHEPRFTAELLASLLSIPPSKTLLRRHLNTHFKELLGRECIQEKRETEATLGYIPLSATTKVKVSVVTTRLRSLACPV